jgi:hypothetical protein
LSHSTSPLCVRYFWDRVSRTTCLGWFSTVILLISASWVAWATGAWLNPTSFDMLCFVFHYLSVFSNVLCDFFSLTHWLFRHFLLNFKLLFEVLISFSIYQSMKHILQCLLWTEMLPTYLCFCLSWNGFISPMFLSDFAGFRTVGWQCFLLALWICHAATLWLQANIKLIIMEMIQFFLAAFKSHCLHFDTSWQWCI